MEKKILIADDHFVVREGTSFIIKSCIPDVTINYAENYEILLEKIKAERFDLLFLDIHMPGSKYEYMIKELKNIDSKIKILVFSVYEERMALKYITEGANGYLNKLSTKEKIIEAVKDIFDKGYYYSPEIMQEMFLENQGRKTTNPIDVLSAREKDIAHLLIEGNGNLEISNILNLKMSTISTVKKRILNKLKLKNIIELAKLYENNRE